MEWRMTMYRKKINLKGRNAMLDRTCSSTTSGKVLYRTRWRRSVKIIYLTVPIDANLRTYCDIVKIRSCAMLFHSEIR